MEGEEALKRACTAIESSSKEAEEFHDEFGKDLLSNGIIHEPHQIFGSSNNDGSISHTRFRSQRSL